jgi:hypothetical protein
MALVQRPHRWHEADSFALIFAEVEEMAEVS